MDKSKKYIEMCSKTQEIQGLKKTPSDGDFCCSNNTNFHTQQPLGEKVFVFVEEAWFKNIPSDVNPNVKCVWLPRQDQLLDILDKNGSPIDVLRYIHLKTQLDYYSMFSSMEEYLLAFVMEKKFSKVWNEKEEIWVKIK